jgi:K+-sensing histidine kinase KdpD
MIDSTHKTAQQKATQVVVGVADTLTARAALRMAAKLADLYSLPLHLVRVVREHNDEHHDRVILDDAARLARYVAPKVEVLAEFATGDIYAVLLDRARSAHTLVLGAAEKDGVPGAIGRWYLDHAACPVLVVDAEGRAVAGTLHASPFAAV